MGWCRQTHKNQCVTKSTAVVGLSEQVKERKRKLVKVRVNLWGQLSLNSVAFSDLNEAQIFDQESADDETDGTALIPLKTAN